MILLDMIVIYLNIYPLFMCAFSTRLKIKMLVILKAFCKYILA